MKKHFGYLLDGTAVDQYTLTKGDISCEILTYGGALRALRVPDRQGRAVDVLLGFDRLEDYLAQDKYMGALVGRYANRIGDGTFEMNGVTYSLAKNNGANHLHGGMAGFDKQIWHVECDQEDMLTLSLVSPDGQEGYPGTLRVEVTYRLEDHDLAISYTARTDRDTVCNLTNHAYFNLSGHGSGKALHQKIQLFADYYTPSDAGSIPTGEIAPVTGTPMDLRYPVPIGEGLSIPYEQLVLAGGFDHNWIITGEQGQLKLAARASSPDTGIMMEMLTTEPGVQFYTGNYLDGCPVGKGGVPYGKHWGFCLEAQHYPDSPHHPHFPSAILRAGEEYRQATIYRFLQTGTT